MKRVNIQNIRNKQVGAVWTWQTNYGVWLDWGVNVSFSNKKDAKRFLAWVNERLTVLLIDCNDIAGGLYVEFRRCYLVLVPADRKNINKLFASCEVYFSRITDNSSRHSISFSVVKDINDLAGLLGQIGGLLLDHNKKKNRFTDARFCQAFINRCEMIKQTLNELPTSYTDMQKPI